MAKKKSAAQIRRMQMRAENRGENYVAPEPEPEPTEDNSKDDIPRKTSESKADKKLRAAAVKLKKELAVIQNNDQLKAKERRSQKRKAEAIAAEEAGCSAEEIMKGCEDHEDLLQKLEKEKPSKVYQIQQKPKEKLLQNALRKLHNCEKSL